MMNMLPVISVIVPVYNVEKYIGRLIDSLINQTLKNIELILVDDGSPDRCGAICDAYAAKDKRIKVIHKPNGGVGAARNDGLDAATGEWVLFCDSDDWLETDALEKLAEAGERAGADVVFGDVNLAYETCVKPAPFYRQEFVTEDREQIDQLIAADFCRAYCFDAPEGGPAFGYGGPWNKLVRRRLLLENNIRFDLRVKGIFDDIIYTAYIFATAKRIAYKHVMVYNYRQLPTSITQTYKANLLEIDCAIFTAWQEFMQRYGRNGQFLKPYYACVIRRLDNALGRYFFHAKNMKALSVQLSELKTLMHEEPYKTAIQCADKHKLHQQAHKLVLFAAQIDSALLLYLFHQARMLRRKLKKTR